MKYVTNFSRILILITLFFVFQYKSCLSKEIEPPQTPKPVPNEKTPKEASDKIDILAKVLELNSSKYAKPPTTFRKGHVTNRTLDKNALKKIESGFSIQFPSKAPIPSPAIYDGMVFVSGGFRSKEFYCLNATDGKLVWGLNLDDDGPSSAVVDQNVAVFNTESCTIFAVDAKTGKQLWSYWLGDPLMSTPTIANGLVFTAYPASNRHAKGKNKDLKAPPGMTHVAICIELKSGKIRWQKWIDSDVMSAPIATKHELYITSFGGTIYKFKQNDGTIYSAQKTGATSAVVVSGEQVFYSQREDSDGNVKEGLVSSDRKNLKQAFVSNTKVADYLNIKVQAESQLAESGKKNDSANGFAGGAPIQSNWEAGYGNIGQSSVCTLQAFQGSRVLNWRRNGNFSCMGDELVATDPNSGETRWKLKLKGDLKKAGGFLAAPPVAAGNRLFIGTLNGEILQVIPESGVIEKRYAVGTPIRSQPAIHEGRIYIGTTTGKLIMIDTKNKTFTGWPMWGGDAGHSGAK